MSIRSLAAATAFALSIVPALAHGPTPQKVDETVTIAAEPAKVWAVVKDFGALQSWHPDVAKSTLDGTDRTVTLKKGGEFKEGLDATDDAGMEIDYRLSGDAGEALPVSSYSVSIKVAPKDGGSQVTWEGRFYRADTNNEPEEGKDDAAAVAGMTEFLKTGLEGLKKKIEAGG
ncbi:SRPBCC family protein [Hansschlegelia plantiphila]|uniref:MxaD family protein n=1 Tax=Hansschlegelia plantiphila TaxID=374655 RepID=A0A9W6J1G9_9HYPH|nr:SRPBCC family protein [Hansschlegelia plantiphila]GLK67998.1 MxaD family protein [Hansschlegelia plantiphila]